MECSVNCGEIHNLKLEPHPAALVISVARLGGFPYYCPSINHAVLEHVLGVNKVAFFFFFLKISIICKHFTKLS